MGFLPPATAAFAPFYNLVAPTVPAASESGVTSNNFPTVAVTADSGVTFNPFSTVPAAAATASRKRPRDAGDSAVSFLGEDISAHVQQHMLDVDRLVLLHAEKVRLELAERRRWFSRQILAAIEQGVAKRLRAKDEEIERIGRVNWALEERIRSLCVENQIWRDMAQTNEAAANVLRNNLEQALAAQVLVKEEEGQGGEAVGDAESCCCGENADEMGVRLPPPPVAEGGAGRRVCWNCREEEPAVLLLPCRHLCLCADCGPVAVECPVCHVMKEDCVLVNIS